MASHIIFLLTFSIIHVSCVQKNSLTFVIDNTLSMGPVISQVKNTAKTIVDIVLNVKSSIEDVVLVTFNDPGVKFRRRTSSGDILKRYINGIQLSGGGDCPEMSLSGIKMALEKSLPGSYLFVFTDASAKDYNKYEEVNALCQEKQSQVFIVLTGGHCRNSIDESNNVYDKIATASNGQVFRVTVDEITKILHWVTEMLKDKNSVLTSQVVPGNSWHNVSFTIDDNTEYAIISASGSGVMLRILDSSRTELTDFIEIISSKNVKVLKLTNLPVGDYSVEVLGKSEVNVIVFGRTDFTFEFGFSEAPQYSLNYTKTQPVKGTKTRLLIEVNDPKLTLYVKTVEILDMKEYVIEILPLNHTWRNLYVTDKFLPPNDMFKIAITAIAHSSATQQGIPIRRLSKTPVEPIVIPEFEESSPSVTVKENTKAIIICKLRDGNPTPTIKWQFRATNSAKYKAMSHGGVTLSLPAAGLQDAGEYRCIAQNSAGDAEKTTRLTVLVPPQFDKTSTLITTRENTPVIIKCKISKGFPIPTVTWWYKRTNATKYVMITKDEQNQRLENIQLDDAGEYKCVAKNIAGEAEQVVEIVVKAPPRIVFIPPNKRRHVAVQGDVVLKLPCTTIGYPTPKISWLVNGVAISNDDSKKMYVDGDGALIVKDPVPAESTEKSHDYVCQASNELGVARQPYEVVVNESVVPDYSAGSETYAEADNPYTLSCPLKSSSPNSVRWFKELSPMNIRGSAILWAAPTSENNGNYTCRVSDINGTAYKTITVVFGRAPSAPRTMIKVDWDRDEDTITCPGDDADPVGTYEWFYQGRKIEKYTSSINLIDWGQYVCRVANPLGSLEVTYNVTSTNCVVEKNISKTKNMPLISEEHGFSAEIKAGNFIVPHSKRLTLFCQETPERDNSNKSQLKGIRKFPGVNKISASCDHEDLFTVDAVSYKFSELDCEERITSSVTSTGERCLGENTMRMQVGVHVEGFMNVYESCMDTNLNVPLYTKVMNTEERTSIVEPIQPEGKCLTLGDCCYESAQLVNEADFLFGPAEATLNKTLNNVFYCKPNHTTDKTWYEIEYDIKKQILTYAVWSGASNYTKLGSVLVPQYLWKVVKNLDTEEITAIVHSNAHAHLPKMCEDACEESTWFEPYGHRTYCCKLEDFKKAFHININF